MNIPSFIDLLKKVYFLQKPDADRSTSVINIVSYFNSEIAGNVITKYVSDYIIGYYGFTLLDPELPDNHYFTF